MEHWSGYFKEFFESEPSEEYAPHVESQEENYCNEVKVDFW